MESKKRRLDPPSKSGYHDELQVVKLNVNLDLFVTNVAEQLLKEYKYVFAWTYKNLRGIPPPLMQHWTKFDTNIFASHQARYRMCRNPSLGLATKVRAYEGVGQDWSLGVTFHVPMNVGECEGMNPHTPKWIPTLEVDGLPNFQRAIAGVKTHWIKKFLISLEIS